MMAININNISKKKKKKKNIIDTRWVLLIKKNDNTKKARLVVKSCQQKEGEVFISSYSPTALSDSLRISNP